MPTAAVLGGASILGAITGSKASSKAAKASKAGSDAALRHQKEAASQARGDLLTMFPNAQRTGQEGFQGALDVFGQSLPAQTDSFMQGNVGAQNAILAGMPQMQNAILGGNVDYSQFQPFQMEQPDLSFFNQTLPQTQYAQDQASAADAAAKMAALQQQQWDAASQGPAQSLVNNPVIENRLDNILRTGGSEFNQYAQDFQSNHQGLGRQQAQQAQQSTPTIDSLFGGRWRAGG